ncbi:putative baseplate assembly protein [Streptomyces broussonetiae]|uniref:putative baseplate assembly protein n=1 Tax=Streptomyces broussonetiae TaxID=2686304 RepID=UPI001E2FA829|nr:putative baseplate assembly protein [Streptomyces broussonetiae]
MSSTDCRTDQRRGAVRAARLHGLDEVETGDDGRTLTVTFLGKAPHHLTHHHVRIEGGRRIRDVHALAVEIVREDDPELDDRMFVRLDRAGDTSPYRLRVVETDAFGRPGTQPRRGFDVRYAAAEFTFTQGGPSPYDCGEDEEDCAPQYARHPVTDYTARDYDSLRRLILDRMSLTAPGWVERHVPDVGTALVELLAYSGDQLSYQQDAVATEAYLSTARRRVSVRRHVRLIDYAMHDGCNARTFVALQTDRQLFLGKGEYRFAAIDLSRLGPQERPDFGTVIADEDLDALANLPVGLEVFEPVIPSADLSLRPDHNEIGFWTWGEEECVLPKGATSATLRDTPERGLKLKPGDLLVLEEVLGPRTGTPAGADPTHRQVVRLTSVTPGEDELYEQPIVEVRWGQDDALTFALSLSARGGLACGLITGISVARGNVVLVDHGRSLTFCNGAPERFAVPPAPAELRPCGPVALGCSDERTQGSPAAEAVHALLDQTGSGRPLTPEQVRALEPLLGPDAVARAGISVVLAPGTTVEERVQPATADAQAAALETLLAQTTYPAIAPRFRPVLRYAPVTQATPYPDPARIAAGQAARLAAVPARLRERIEELWRRAEEGEPPTEGEIDELTVVFGARTIQRLRIGEHPGRALRELYDRRTRLLAGKLRRLEVLTARAHAGTVLNRYVAWEIAQSWGERYAAELDPSDPVLAGPAADGLRQNPRTALPALRAQAGDGVWTPRRDLLADGPRGHHLVGEVEDDGRLALRFGDGKHGAPPPPGTTLEVAYRVGNGAAGNVGAEAVNHLVVCRGSDESGRGARSRRAAFEAVTAVRNPLPAVGGTEPEAVDEVRRLAPLAPHRRLERAITPGDYAALAAQVPGVRRAAAELRWTGSGREMHIAVEAVERPRSAVAGGPAGAVDFPEPGEALLQAVEHSLLPYRRIGHELVVRPALQVPIDLALSVCVDQAHQLGHVEAELRRVLGNRRLPDGRLGFFHPDALAFGEPVRVSRLVAVAAAVPGVLSAKVTRLRRLFRADQGELAAGTLPVGALEVACCDNDPARPENGRLGIEIGGGR